MPKLSAQNSTTAAVGAIELFLFGLTLGFWVAGTINPHLFSNARSLLALKIVCGVWGGLIAVTALAMIVLPCWGYAVEARDYKYIKSPGVSGSQLRSSCAACVMSTFAIKALSIVSGIIVAVGCGAIFSPGIREKMHLSMAASIAIIVVGMLAMLLSATVLPKLALNLSVANLPSPSKSPTHSQVAASLKIALDVSAAALLQPGQNFAAIDPVVDHCIESTGKFVCDALCSVLSYSGPISIAVAATIESSAVQAKLSSPTSPGRAVPR